jgi:hypothetical protein
MKRAARLLRLVLLKTVLNSSAKTLKRTPPAPHSCEKFS